MWLAYCAKHGKSCLYITEADGQLTEKAFRFSAVSALSAERKRISLSMEMTMNLKWVMRARKE
jgi:hypothetical protein